MGITLLAAHPVDIYKACDSLFGDEPWLSWEPETLLLHLAQEVSDAEVDKLLAVKSVAANSNAVVQSAAAFEKTVTAFCNSICVMDVVQPPEVEEMSYAVSQIVKIIKEVHGEKQVVWTGEVPGYVASVAKFRGWVFLPGNLSFGQEMLNYLTGVSPKSKLYKENKAIFDTITTLASTMRRIDARSILEHASIKELESNDSATTLIRQLVGALLYDPTTYAENTNQPVQS